MFLHLLWWYFSLAITSKTKYLIYGIIMPLSTVLYNRTINRITQRSITLLPQFIALTLKTGFFPNIICNIVAAIFKQELELGRWLQHIYCKLATNIWPYIIGLLQTILYPYMNGSLWTSNETVNWLPVNIDAYSLKLYHMNTNKFIYIFCIFFFKDDQTCS